MVGKVQDIKHRMQLRRKQPKMEGKKQTDIGKTIGLFFLLSIENGSKPYMVGKVQDIEPRVQLRRKQPKMKEGGKKPNRHRNRLFMYQKPAIPKTDYHPPRKLSIYAAGTFEKTTA